MRKMQEEVVKKYVRDLEALKKEVESHKQRFKELSNGILKEEALIYHELVIFLFSIIYKYLIFESIPIFSGGKGLDAYIQHEDGVIAIEFEVFSSDFPKHHTDEQKEECKLVICWRDNSRKKHEFWKHIDVFELKYFWE